MRKGLKSLSVSDDDSGDSDEEDEENPVTVTVKHLDSEKEDYLNEELSICNLFEVMATHLVEAHPEDPLDSLIEFLSGIKDGGDLDSEEEEASGEEEVSEEEEESEEEYEEEDDGMGELQERKPPPSIMRNRRTSVSAECRSVADQLNEKVKLRVVEKSEKAKTEILEAVKDNILFTDLDNTLRKYIVDAVEEMKYPAGHFIIKQGGEGDYFYVLSEGEVDIYLKKGDQEFPGVVVDSVGPPASFGELALMYMCPRAASVVAKTDVTLWALDRATFRQIMSDTNSKKRKLHEQFLKNVPLLGGLDKAERAKIADVLEVTNFSDGEKIITQGEPGDKFFILEDGTAIAEMDVDGKVEHLRDYRSGDYFAELALLADKPRAATVKATSNCVCLSMSRVCFKRLLGSLEDTIRHNAGIYKFVMKEVLSN